MKSWLDLKNFSVYFDDLPFIKNLNLSLENHDSLAIFGPTSSGKSVLLKGILGMLPTSGSMTLLNHTSQSQTPELSDLDSIYGQIGFAFQQNGLFDFCSIQDNLLFGKYMQPRRNKTAEYMTQEEMNELLENLGLWEHRNKFPDQLSGGQKKRLSIARALSKRPRILITDDPLAGLDPVTSITVLNLLGDVVKKYDVGLIVTISSSAIVEGRFTHCLVLQNGNPLFFGTGKDFKKEWPVLTETFKK
jgi:phospholipid/cholesterol/gamma-HCH transport system ATP-binding protein